MGVNTKGKGYREILHSEGAYCLYGETITKTDENVNRMFTVLI